MLNVDYDVSHTILVVVVYIASSRIHVQKRMVEN